jgi:hypothetical protein
MRRLDLDFGAVDGCTGLGIDCSSALATDRSIEMRPGRGEPLIGGKDSDGRRSGGSPGRSGTRRLAMDAP